MSKKRNSTSADKTKPVEKPVRSSQRRTASKLPVCLAMVICERVIVSEDDKTLSVIRIVDTISLPPDVIDKGSKGAELSALKLLVIVRKAEASGAIKLKLVCADPTGRRDTIGTSQSITLDGEDELMGTHLTTSVRLINIKEGIYWIELLANDSLIARTPLRVRIEKEKTSEAADSATTRKEGFMPPPPLRERLTGAHFVQPASIDLEFADKEFTLNVDRLGMPVDRIRWGTATASPGGEFMTVQGIKGEEIPIDSSTLRYLVDSVYAAEMNAALGSLQFTRKELQEMARDNPPPPELFAQSEQDLTSESWK